ncbi:MAG TPA: hypothetical protein VNK03_06485 [Gammaproteobacteria bacterium]|nr:hypothetical protein [Gammaproteobacteria bacterium]
MQTIIILLIGTLIFLPPAYARECRLPKAWKSVCNILEQRVNQTSPKMKLKESEVVALEQFLATRTFVNIDELQSLLPKTSIELLIAIRFRAVSSKEAESIAHYLKDIVGSCQFQNIKAFDNNTSHIIGREWHEIDYSGEGMTWKKQQAPYAPYGITNFKTLENVKKFFPVESKLPYFKKIYKPLPCKIFDQ